MLQHGPGAAQQVLERVQQGGVSGLSHRLAGSLGNAGDVDVGAERREPDQDQEDHGPDVLPRRSASIFEDFDDADHQ